MKRWVVILAVLGAGMMVVLAQGMRGLGRTAARKATQLRLERAVWAVEANLDGLHEAGYVRWTPTAAARTLAPVLTAAETLSPEEAAELGAAAVAASGPTLQYVVGAPSGPWQVALIPDDAHGTIQVDAYGPDPSRPLVSRSMRVSEW